MALALAHFIKTFQYLLSIPSFGQCIVNYNWFGFWGFQCMWFVVLILYLIIQISRQSASFRISQLLKGLVRSCIILFLLNSFWVAGCCTEVYSEHGEMSKVECFAKIINDLQPLNIFAKCSVLDVWQGTEYTSAIDHLRQSIQEWTK